MINAGLKVLVAEDEPYIRLLLVEAFNEAGYEVLEAHDGEEALRLIGQADYLHAVVSDINMPGYSGFIVAAHARTIRPKLPIIFITGRPDQVRTDHLPQPFRSFHKPFRLLAVVEAVEEMLLRANESNCSCGAGD